MIKYGIKFVILNLFKRINVTNDEQNAEGYGDEVLWFERSLIDLDFKPYGLINIDTLQRNPKSWGLVTPWDEQQ